MDFRCELYLFKTHIEASIILEKSKNFGWSRVFFTLDFRFAKNASHEVVESEKKVHDSN